MRLSHVGSILLVAAVSTGCDTHPTATDLPAAPEPLLGAAGGVQGSTAGGGKAQLPPGFTLLGFSFNAKAFAGGTASGQFRYRYTSASGTVDSHGTVTCVTFDAANARAWVGGVVTQNNSTNPGALQERHQVGRDVWFRVVDYGDGQLPDDRTTVLGFEGDAGSSRRLSTARGSPGVRTMPIRGRSSMGTSR